MERITKADSVLISARSLKVEHIDLQATMTKEVLGSINQGDDVEVGFDSPDIPEWVWVRVLDARANTVRGRIISTPRNTEDINCGDILTFNKDKILSVLPYQ